ncbi:MAG TPA: hypothetical protein VEQ58_05860 [Polyangiaceae bacterium]|nr:hypothetical protein [Polyangiaceae bacterium]
MAQPLKTWTVLPHGKLSPIDENLLTVVGELPMPLGDFPRRMTVARLQDGRLVIFSAIALDEAEMAQLEAFGTLSYLVVPGDIHRMDAKIWKERYPSLIVIAPEGARKKVEEVVAVDTTNADFGDDSVRFVTVPGTEEHEAALLVKTASGTTLVVNDLIWNVDNRPGFGGFLFRLMGLTGPDPQIPSVVKLRGIKDKPALRHQLEQWATIRDLNRIIVSHGAMVERDPAVVLRDLAYELAA